MERQAHPILLIYQYQLQSLQTQMGMSLIHKLFPDAKVISWFEGHAVSMISLIVLPIAS